MIYLMGTAERKEREKEERLNAILDAALDVFAEYGLQNATMDQIAENAEISRGTLYNFFGSKETLFVALDLRGSRMLRERFAAAARTPGNGHDRVKAIGRAYKQFCGEYPSYFKVMAYVGQLDGQALEEAFCTIQPDGASDGRRALEVLVEVIEAGVKDGSIRADANPWLTATLLWALSNGVILMLRNRQKQFEMAGAPITTLYEEFERLLDCGLARKQD